ncbi:cupin domain-containing protein [Streptomyces sp. NPDC006197]|uniref:cupin domain-containing protein n=1 Tax=Streptomyces sp. NPDC006197 TaxID=3156685 RepID=UPI0033AABE55
MTHTPVRIEQRDARFLEAYGPLALDRRSRASALTDLAGGFAEFTDSTPAEPATLPYEELLYVIEGEVTLTVGDQVIVGSTGDFITLEKGATVVFAGTAGTRLFYAVTPADWKH